MFSSPLELVLFAVSFQFPAPESTALGARMLWRGKIDALSFSWSGLSTLRVFPLISSPLDLGQVSPGRSRPSLGSFVLASEVLVSSSPEALGGVFRGCCPVLLVLVVQPMSLFPHLKFEGLHLFLWPLSGNKMRRAGFSQRVAQFAAEAFRHSTRDTFVSRLGPLSGSGALRSFAIPLLPL